MDELATIKNIIYEVRGMKVMFDSDLAKMYEVETKNLNKAVKRNIERFPPDFMFQLTKEEWDYLRFQIGMLKEERQDNLKFQNGMSSLIENQDDVVLRSQIATLKSDENQEDEFLRFQIGTSKTGDGEKDGRGGTRYLPYAFTEQGVAMLSSVLRSERAIAVNIAIMRAFVAVRQALPLVASQRDVEDLKGRVREVAVTEETAAIGDMRDELRNIYAALDQMQQQPQKTIEPVGYEATLEREKNTSQVKS